MPMALKVVNLKKLKRSDVAWYNPRGDSARKRGRTWKGIMVRDYETPTVPPAWEEFARAWAERVGLSDKNVSLVCSPDRYGNATVLRLHDDNNQTYIATRRSSDVEDAAERRQNFLRAVQSRSFNLVEIDVAGYFIGEGSVPCPWCGGAKHEEWQHVIVRELLRASQPPNETTGQLSPEDADEAELAELDGRVRKLLDA